MTDIVLLTAWKIQDIVKEKGNVSLFHLETMIDASYNLIFLAIDQLVAENKIKLIKGEWGYTLTGCEDLAGASFNY